MTNRPILFSGPMVRANFAGFKTQTRRVLKDAGNALRIVRRPVYSDDGSSFLHHRFVRQTKYLNDAGEIPVRVQIGDRLWVREAWRSTIAYDDLAPRDMGGEEPIRYEADGHWETWGWTDHGRTGRQRQGMHMPRWASRTTLFVTDVRVQRLQDIRYKDTIAEGIEATDIWQRRQEACVNRNQDCGSVCRDSFAELWDSLNATRGFGWATNPWVTATTYTVHRCNIDQMETAA